MYTLRGSPTETGRRRGEPSLAYRPPWVRSNEDGGKEGGTSPDAARFDELEFRRESPTAAGMAGTGRATAGYWGKGKATELR